MSDIRLIQGECSAVMAGMDAESIDMVLTSPPYDALRTYRGFVFDFEAIAAQLYRVLKPGGVIVWVVGDSVVDGSETGESFRQVLHFKSLGLRLHDTMIYEKNGPAHPDVTRYHQVFEYMFVLSKGAPKTINLISDRKNRWGGEQNFGTRTSRHQDGSLGSSTLAGRTVKQYGVRYNIWNINGGFGYSATDDIAYEHPAIFPEALARDHILSWSNPGDIVLDPMVGSGTTPKMAYLHDRNCIGIDISSHRSKSGAPAM